MKLNPLGQHMHEPTDLAHIWDLPRGKKLLAYGWPIRNGQKTPLFDGP